MGWRYLLFTLGGMTIILWAIRLFVFPLYESPRFLVGIGRDAEAVEVVHRIAAYNGCTSNLSLLDLQAAAMAVGGQKSEGETKLLSRSSVFTMDHIKGLFATPKLASSTSLLIFLWGKEVRSGGARQILTLLDPHRYNRSCIYTLQQLLAVLVRPLSFVLYHV